MPVYVTCCRVLRKSQKPALYAVPANNGGRKRGGTAWYCSIVKPYCNEGPILHCLPYRGIDLVCSSGTRRLGLAEWHALQCPRFGHTRYSLYCTPSISALERFAWLRAKETLVSHLSGSIFGLPEWSERRNVELNFKERERRNWLLLPGFYFMLFVRKITTIRPCVFHHDHRSD